MLNTLNILPRIFGVHISHDPIPLDFKLVSEQFLKEVISKTSKRAFHNLGVDKPYFCSHDSGKSFGFCWVFLPMLSFHKLLQGCSCTQSDSCCSPFPHFLQIIRDKMMNIANTIIVPRSLGLQVLGRELSLSEIEWIAGNTDTEIEAFVRGVLCILYSGQCFSSEAWGGRSANRSQCAQVSSFGSPHFLLQFH